MPLAEAPHWPPTPTALFCSNATGVPGEVAVEVKDGVKILQATPNGFVVRSPTLELPGSCPEVYAQPNGAAVAVNDDVGRALVAAVRDPGGAWGAPVQLARSEDWQIESVRSAVAPSGDAVVAWTERQILEETYRIRVARRAPGQPFGPVETFGSRLPAVAWAGVASTGETFLMSATIESQRLPLSVPIRLAIAPRGAPVPAPTEIARTPWGALPALAVAPDGRALAAVPDGTSLNVFERAPGEAFGPATPVGPASDAEAVFTDVALGADGAAAVVWTGDREEARAIVTRRGPGAFTPPVTLEPRVPFTGDPFFVSQTLRAIGGLDDGVRAYRSSLILTGDGHAAFAAQPAPRLDGLRIPRAQLTTIPLGGDRAESQILGGAIGFAVGADPLELADGRPALTWSEWIEEDETLHLAAPDATTPADPSPPKVTVGAPAQQVIDASDDVKLPVRCSGPCDVRVQSIGGPIAYGRLRLPRGGTGKLILTQGSVPLAPRHLGRVRLRVTYGSLATQQPRERVISLRLERAPEGRRHDSRPFGLRAVLRGGTIRVSWKVRDPSSIEVFFITGAETREWSGEPAAFNVTYGVDRERKYKLTLRDDARVRFVTLRNIDGSVRLTVPLKGATRPQRGR